MNDARVRPENVSTVYGQDDDLTHLYCCDISVAMCGADLTNSTEVDSDENECVVCCDLADMDLPCRPGCTDWGER